MTEKEKKGPRQGGLPNYGIVDDVDSKEVNSKELNNKVSEFDNNIKKALNYNPNKKKS